MLFAIRSGPLRTWVGMLSATQKSSSSPVITQQEKSRPVLRITERPVRISVFDMLRTIAVKRLDSTARSTGSKGCLTAPLVSADRLIEHLLGRLGGGRRVVPVRA